MKIAIGCIFYNNAKELKRLLDSIPKDSIYYFIGVDGCFKYTKERYSELPDLSTDGSDQLIFDYGEDNMKSFIGVIVEKPHSTEFEKRQAYLETCEKLGDIDVLIIVDTDEFFVYEPYHTPEEHWQRFKKNLEFEMQKYQHHNVFGINFIDEVGTKTYKPRVWVNPHEMRYLYGSHYHYANPTREKKDIELFNQNKLCYIQQAQAIVKGLTLKHDNSLRSKDYLERREQYQRYLVKYEELVQRGKSHEEADVEAKQNPSSDFKPT